MKDRIIKGIFWLGGASLLSQAATWLSTIVVARILNPSDYGLIALAGIYIGFAEYVNEFGIGTAIIQKKDLDPQDIRGLYTISILLGAAMTLLTILLAPAVAAYFKEDRLIGIIQFLSPNFLVNAAKSVQRNLMIREMKFTELAKMDGGSRIITSLGALGLAMAGFGVWTLAAQYLLQNVIVFIWSFAYERRLPGKVVNFDRLKEMLVFGAGITGTNILYCTNRNIDQFIVGKMLGKMTLGSYSFAQTLADKPFEKLLSIFNQVFFPVFSRIQDDPQKTKSYFMSIMEKELFILTPIFLMIILTAQDLVHVVLGSKWELMILPLQLFALIAVFKYLENRISMMYRSRGKSRAQLVFTSLVAVVMSVALFTGGKHAGLTGVLAAWGIAYPLIVMGYLRGFLLYIGISWKKFFALFSVPLISAIVMTIPVLLTASLFQTVSLYSLLFKIFVCLLSYSIAVLLMNRRIVNDLRDIFITQFGKTRQAV
ncbi:lipopolysaccharide biosynthesis protein [Pelotalea chapellei]|uniref:Lipopolysaccharide biosynthesis protein n=1 Tax=Pelotalea chapellei TaxID=44671 RepID=A0ABS5U5D9_9BACT|nr:lipopolysaccharide biosynthesis protein [Pelotalea chapellei]MBT1070890.1 lipopolysaccharide biosynthesis protein [Pelotalea chapellei]